jgi:AAA+ superfamily predicted ATPase
MRDIFRGGTVSQFIVHGNVFDLVGDPSREPEVFSSLRDFLSDVLFAPFEVVLSYNRGVGLQVLKGKEEFQKFLKLLDEWTLTNFCGSPLPRDPLAAFDLMDRFVHYSCRTRTVMEDSVAKRAPLKTAVMLDFVQFIVPQGEASMLSDRASEILIRLLGWASDPSLMGANVISVLITENLAELNRILVDSPYVAKIRIPLPTEADGLSYVKALARQYPELEKLCEVSLDTAAQKMVGLTRVNQHNLVAQAVRNNRSITADYLRRVKKSLIEKECYGLLDFLESNLTLDDVAGLDAAKSWLREDGRLIRAGRYSSLPMGYLMTGRIGTGKSWLANCWAGEVGVPFVGFKNFRDRWMGATEGNLEKIFNVLRALGQVIVFVDEADQMTGKRGGSDSDGGLAGRVYAMLAKEMSDTRNRGRIIWIFATSRPDLVEVDLKRPGRLDVHIPLFPPQSDDERQQLFRAMARKVKLPLEPHELPVLPPHIELGGNEMEALMVRAMRRHELAQADAEAAIADRPDPHVTLTDILAQVLTEYRPLPHARHLEYMDLVAVKECTDTQFLPEHYRTLLPADLDLRLDQLKAELHLS